jgi:CRISPR/Cas system CMR subunit Cmr6 (Cas7 group RAMP superfamily)
LAQPKLGKDDRRRFFADGFGCETLKNKIDSWSSWVQETGLRLIADEILFAQLKSRLMINMAGGVMENAGLCLDRFGLPYVPGSAVKGCARRAATLALFETEAPEAKAKLLLHLALIFGWGDTDWKAGRRRKRQNGQEVETEPYSDYWWAMASESGNRQADDARRHQTWRNVALHVASALLDHLDIGQREHPSEPWEHLPSYAGCVSFLPAYLIDLGRAEKVEGIPLDVPPLNQLELDVVTCHHSEYYRDNPAYASAADTEEPVPVVFPAVAPGHVFLFPLAKLRKCRDHDLKVARTWLQTGLETFGLGAKTNAGYGWLRDVSKSVCEFLKTQTELREIQAKAERFIALSDDARLQFIIELAGKSQLCRAWRKRHPEAAKEVDAFANEMGSPLP